MSALLRKMKDPVAKKRKASVDLGLSDSSGDEMFTTSQERYKGGNENGSPDRKTLRRRGEQKKKRSAHAE